MADLQARPHLLFIHGFLGSGDDWNTFRDALSGEYHSSSIDLDQWSPCEEYSLEFIAEQIAQSLDEDAGGTIVIGYSMGARVALSLALRNPELLRALILESPSAGIAEESERQQRAEKDARLAAMIREEGMESFLERWYSIPLFESLRRKPLKLAALKEKILLRQQQEQAAYMLEKLSPGRAPNYWPELFKLQLPTLLIAGELDTKFSDSAREMAEVLPQATLKIIKDTGHNIHLEKPEVFLETIRQFLAKQNMG